MDALSDSNYQVGGNIDLEIKVDGTPVDCSAALVSVETLCAAGKVAMARIVFQDNPETLSESDSDAFAIGKKVEIAMGMDGTTSPVFKGIVTGRSLKISEEGTEVIVSARHEAFRMTLDRRFRSHEKATDSGIIKDTVEAYSIPVQVDNTTVTHEKIVQYNCTDWDLVNMRAEAAGLVLFTAPDGIRATDPDVSKEPALTVTNGYSLNTLALEIHGRDRFKSIKAEAWNYSSQAFDKAEADIAGKDTAQGMEDTVTLAGKIGNGSRTLRLLSGQGNPDAMEQLAAAEAARAAMSRITGKLSVPGFPGVLPMDIISLEGIGKRFEGKALVTTVIQTYQEGTWETILGLGTDDLPFHLRFSDIASPPADGVSASTPGLQAAVVAALEGDPEGEERVQVNLMGDKSAALWARMALPYAGKGRGSVFLPEIGDEVIVGFMGGNPSEAVIVGTLHSSKAPSPLSKTDDNDLKGVVTREGLRLEFDEKKKHILLETPGGNRVLLSDDKKGLLLQDQNGNKVTLGSDGIVLDSAKDIAVKAKGDVQVEGTNINLSARVKLTAKGNGSAEISSSGNTVVRGSIVQIN